MLARLAVAASDAGLTARAVLRFRERTNRWLSAGRRYFSLETGRASGSNRQVFEPSWKPGTGRYGETVGQMNRSGIGNIHELVLPYLGGLLVILTYGLPDNYRDLVPDVDVTAGQNDTWSNMMFMRLVDDFEGAWRELREKRAITEEEYVKYMVPVALRTAKELQLPFEDVTSPVRSAGMTLEFHDQMIVPDIAKAAWLAQTP
ncbi:hypothetical protein BaRGS_00031341, partial [Batillaria attramentaria]